MKEGVRLDYKFNMGGVRMGLNSETEPGGLQNQGCLLKLGKRTWDSGSWMCV